MSRADGGFTPDNGAIQYLGMEIPEQREEIIERLGVKEDPGTELSKSALNSLHAFLTGTFVIKPRNLFAPEAESRGEILFRIANETGLTDYTEHYVDNELDGEKEYRELNKGELATILSEMDDGDQRDWSGGGYGQKI